MNPQRPWPWARVLAHRGGGTLAPENTIGAIRVGIEHGYRAIEFDAMLPRDDVPILMHDPRLGRTVAGEGAITGLEATLAFCRREGVWCNVEIKPAPGREAATGRVVAMTVAAAYADCVRAGGARQAAVEPAVPLLSSFSIDALEAARAAVPDLPRGWLVDRVPSDWQARFDALDCVAVHTNHRHLTPARAAEIKASGAWLFCYTVNEPARAGELLAWGVDAFCTDRIDLIDPDFAARA